MMKTTLWCTYHKSEIPIEYNLYDSKYLKLFNDDLTLEEDNINFLHDYLGELTTYYYVWKNNIKSDIVGFCHYSKFMKFIDYKRLEHFGFDAYAGCYFNSEEVAENTFFKDPTYISNSYILYLKQRYNINIFKYLKEHPMIYKSWHNIYFFTWDTFCNLCDYMFGFFEFMLPNNGWKDKNNIDLLTQIHIPFNKEEIYSGKGWFERTIVINFEWVIGMYLGMMCTNQICGEYDQYSDNNEDLYFITCKDNFDDFDNLKKWLKQNIKSGVTNYIVRSSISKELIFDEIQKPLSAIMNQYVYKLIICNSDDEYDEQVKQFNCDNKFININLKSNQRIHCDSSIEFYQGKFSIEDY